MNPPSSSPPAAGRTLDQMRRELEDISSQCRGTAEELLRSKPRGADADRVVRLLRRIAEYAENACELVVFLDDGPGRMQ